MIWPIVEIKEVAQIVSGSTPSTSKPEYWGGAIPWVTPADLAKLEGQIISSTPRTLTPEGLAASNARLLPAGSVLFSSRAPIGHVAINTVPMATNQGFKSFVPDPEKLVAGFLYWWLKSNAEFLQGLGVGATFKEVSKSIVERVKIPLPPVSEQRRIALVLDQTEELRAKRRRAGPDVQRFKASALARLMRESGATYRRLGDVVETTSGGTPSRSVGANFGGGVPWVKSGEVAQGVVMATEETISSRGLASSSAKLMPVGTVLLAMYGATAGVVGRLGIEAATNQAVCCISPGDSFTSEFLVAMLDSMRERLKQMAVGGAQPNLSQGQIRDLLVPVPTMDVQREFSNQVAAAIELSRLHDKQLRMFNDLFGSVQHLAFAGGLT